MKLNFRLTTLAWLATVPLFLAGCDNNKNTTESNPPSRTDTANVQPDNSAKNTRDRNDATLTPGDQGNTPADREITTKVRKAVVSGTNDYSMTAKNIKIITTGGKVTLRGPVKTEAEKAGIVAIASSVNGVAGVDDQLEVKATP